MNEIDLLQTILDEIHETREIVYCLGIWVVFCLLPFSASGSDDTASIDHIKGTLDIINEYIQTDQYQMFLDWKADELSSLGQVVPVEYQDRVLKTLAGVGVNDTFQWSDTDNVRAYLQALTRAFYGSSSHTSNPLPGSLLDYQRKQFSRLGEVLSTLEALTNSSSSASFSPDVLAGNPWWATNSAFALYQAAYSSAYPDDGLNHPGLFLFRNSFLESPVVWLFLTALRILIMEDGSITGVLLVGASGVLVALGAIPGLIGFLMPFGQIGYYRQLSNAL